MVSYTNQHAWCKIIINSDDTILVQGGLFNPLLYSERYVLAPNPIDRMFNYTGSGLPFPCANIAFEGTPNQAQIDISGLFNVVFKYPNSYYLPDARTKIAPSVFLSLSKNNMEEPELVRFELPDPLPLKTLSYRDGRDGPEFYDRIGGLGVHSQEYILRHMADAKVNWKAAMN